MCKGGRNYICSSYKPIPKASEEEEEEEEEEKKHK